MLSLRPAFHSIRKAVGAVMPDLESAALDRWTIAPACKRFVPPARFLPQQLDRIRAAEFGTVADVVRDFRGGYEATQGETLGFRVKHVDLVDGVIYARRAQRNLRPRTRRLPAYAVPREVVSGCLYESWLGNRWFGNWLSDDCLTYPLSESFGAPVRTAAAMGGHAPHYASLLGLRPKPVDRVHFEELIFFRDSSHNDHKKARADQFRARLMAGSNQVELPGVFLLRGTSGAKRILANETSLAEMLSAKRGFRVLDPSSSSVSEIIRCCAGARVIAGVEGSHLVHGLMMMLPSSALFVIQPPDRVVSVLKIITDRQGQVYSFLVGAGSQDSFTVDWGEVDRTLDLALA